MAKRLSPEFLRHDSIEQINEFLGTLDGAKILTRLPSVFAKRYSHGWQLPVMFSDQSRELIVLIDGDFPFSLPRIAIADGPKLLDWPHLERHGLLCVEPDMAAGSPLHAKAMVRRLLADACALIEHNIHGNTDEELRDEFLSYWGYACDRNARSCVSIVSPIGPSRAVAVWKGRKAWYFADTAEVLLQWLEHRFGQATKRPRKTESAWLVWRPEPWLPSEYPESALDLSEILSAEHEAFSIERVIDDAVDGITVIVGAPTNHGTCFAAVIHKPPGRIKLGPKRRGAEYLTKGFRPGHVPKSVQAQRALSANATIQKSDTSRADSAWIHGRDQNEHHDVIKEKRVAIVGCGSLGSEIATLLVKAGVGNLTLVDGELLEWANISRHSLGAVHVGKHKATAMKEALAEAFPHALIDPIAEPLKLSNRVLLQRILTADLIVSATGAWSAASLLNAQWLDAREAPDMIVAWMEAHAIAAHSVHFSKNEEQGCLQCGCSATGAPVLAVTQWKIDPTCKVPACGGFFVPYGPVGLSRAAGVAAEQCLDVLSGQSSDDNHRVWIDQKRHLQATGGEWAERWVREIGDPGIGGSLVFRRWDVDSVCTACAGSSL